MKPSRNPTIANEVPWSDHVTPYDREHFTVFLRLLDAAADDASTEEMSRIVLGIDPTNEPARAKQALDSHLRRAHWMSEHGYRNLMQ
jgi:hypothetical protein